MNPHLYLFLADLVVILHLGFVLYVVFGGLLALRWPRAWRWHLPALAWGVGIELGGGICPLTPLEQGLREAGGGGAYSGGFIEHYLLPLLYPAGLDPSQQQILGIALLIWSILIYGMLWRRRRGYPS